VDWGLCRWRYHWANTSLWASAAAAAAAQDAGERLRGCDRVTTATGPSTTFHPRRRQHVSARWGSGTGVASCGALGHMPLDFQQYIFSVHFLTAQGLTATSGCYPSKHFTVCYSSCCCLQCDIFVVLFCVILGNKLFSFCFVPPPSLQILATPLEVVVCRSQLFWMFKTFYLGEKSACLKTFVIFWPTILTFIRRFLCLFVWKMRS